MAEAAIARMDLNVVKVIHEDNDKERQAQQKSILEAYSEHRSKWQADIAREKLQLEEFQQQNKQKKEVGEKMSQFVSQKVVDLVSKMDRGEILTVEEQEYMDQTTRHYMDYEDELSQAPTLVDKEISATRVKKPKPSILNENHPVNVAVRRALESDAFSSPTRASPSLSQQSQESTPKLPSASKPKQAKAVEAEKKKSVQPKQAKAKEAEKKKPAQPKQAKSAEQPHQRGDELVTTSSPEAPGLFSLRKRKTIAAKATRESDSETDEVHPTC